MRVAILDRFYCIIGGLIMRKSTFLHVNNKSGLHLCYSPSRKYNRLTCDILTFNILVSLCS